MFLFKFQDNLSFKKWVDITTESINVIQGRIFFFYKELLSILFERRLPFLRRLTVIFFSNGLKGVLAVVQIFQLPPKFSSEYGPVSLKFDPAFISIQIVIHYWRNFVSYHRRCWCVTHSLRWINYTIRDSSDLFNRESIILKFIALNIPPFTDFDMTRDNRFTFLYDLTKWRPILQHSA